MVKLADPAVRLTCCWPKATTAAKERIPATRAEALKVALKVFFSMGLLVLSSSVGLVDHKFPGINQHHHQHSAGEGIVGGDLALVVRVPHKRKASLAGGRVRDRARGRSWFTRAKQARLPPSRAHCEKGFGSGRVAGPPPATSPNGAA